MNCCRRFGLAVLLLGITAALNAAVLPFTSAASYATQAAKAQPGDTLLMGANVIFPYDTVLPAGVTLDLGGFSASPPPADATKPSGYRLFDVRKGAITVKNGTISGAGWGIFTFYSCSNITITNVRFTDTLMAAIKLSALKDGSVVDNILIDTVTIEAKGRPQTLIDLGPGIVKTTTIRNVSISGPLNAESNTACDGLAIENGQGPITVERITVSGVPGDGVDIKNAAPLVVNDVAITGAVRNGMKIWCHSTSGSSGGVASTADVRNVTVKNCGLEHFVVAAGQVTVDRLTVEAPGAACAWGGGYEYPTDILVKNSSIVRTGESSSWLMFTDGGDSRPLSSFPAKVRFENCRFWGGNTVNLLSPKAGSPVPPLSKQQALAGQWPSIFTNCTYAADPLPPVNHPPSILVEPVQTTVTLPSGFSAAYVASDPDNDPLIVTATVLDPNGALAPFVHDTAAKTIQVTPSVAGVYTVKATVSDGKLSAEAQAFVTVLPKPFDAKEEILLLQERMAGVETTVAALQTKAASLQEAVDALLVKDRSLQNSVNELQASVNALQAKDATLQAGVDAARSDVLSLQTAAKGLQAQVDALRFTLGLLKSGWDRVGEAWSLEK